MNSRSIPYRFRIRWTIAAAVVLGCSAVFSFTPSTMAATAPTPLTTETLKTAAVQYNLTPDQVKILQTDINFVAASQQKMTAFQKSLTPAQAKTKDNLLKLDLLGRELTVAKARLASDQLKFMPVPKK